MSTKLADLVREAAESGRRRAAAFPETTTGNDLPWKVIAAFDADVRGHVERDPRIEDERDRVLIAAVTLAEMPEGEKRDAPRRHLLDAIDDLERSVLRFGIVNRQAAKLGYGAAGDPVASRG